MAPKARARRVLLPVVQLPLESVEATTSCTGAARSNNNAEYGGSSNSHQQQHRHHRQAFRALPPSSIITTTQNQKATATTTATITAAAFTPNQQVTILPLDNSNTNNSSRSVAAPYAAPSLQQQQQQAQLQKSAATPIASLAAASFTSGFAPHVFASVEQLRLRGLPNASLKLEYEMALEDLFFQRGRLRSATDAVAHYHHQRQRLCVSSEQQQQQQQYQHTEHQFSNSPRLSSHEAGGGAGCDFDPNIYASLERLRLRSFSSEALQGEWERARQGLHFERGRVKSAVENFVHFSNFQWNLT